MSRCRRNKDWTQCSPHFKVLLLFSYYMPDDADTIPIDPIAAKQRIMERFRLPLGLVGISQRARQSTDFVALSSYNSCRLGFFWENTQHLRIHKRILSSTLMLSFYEDYRIFCMLYRGVPKASTCKLWHSDPLSTTIYIYIYIYCRYHQHLHLLL